MLIKFNYSKGNVMNSLISLQILLLLSLHQIAKKLKIGHGNIAINPKE